MLPKVLRLTRFAVYLLAAFLCVILFLIFGPLFIYGPYPPGPYYFCGPLVVLAVGPWSLWLILRRWPRTAQYWTGFASSQTGLIALVFGFLLAAAFVWSAFHPLRGMTFEGYYQAGYEINSFVPCGSNRRPSPNTGYLIEAVTGSGFAERYEEYRYDANYVRPVVYVRFIGDLTRMIAFDTGKAYATVEAATSSGVQSGGTWGTIKVTRLLQMGFGHAC